jgi:uncharacterized repeat protein (TIGR03847 family)
MAADMPNVEIELNPVSFITIGTVGPRGKRLFYLQAGDGNQLVSLVIEKEQARALSEALREMLDDLMKREGAKLENDTPDMSHMNMDLREPIETHFRVAQMGLGYDEERDMVVLVAQELVIPEGEGAEAEGIESEPSDLPSRQPGVARFWGTRQQLRALSLHASHIVKQGRVDPQSNGRVLFYWT